MFDFLIEILTKNGKGIHAYRACAEEAYRAASGTPGAEAAFFLLGRSAEAFADTNERMPINAGDIDTAFRRYSEAVARLNTAWDGGSEADRLDALNWVAVTLAAQAA